MDTTTASASSIRMCSCGKRLSRLIHDSHTFCPDCTGHACNLTTRCNHCDSWSEERMKKYLKQQNSLNRKRLSKIKKTKDARNIDLSCVVEQSPGEIFASDSTDDSDLHSITDSIHREQSNNTFFDEANELERHVEQKSEEKMEDKIAEKLDDRFQKRIEGMLVGIADLIDNKIDSRLSNLKTNASGSSSRVVNGQANERDHDHVSERDHDHASERDRDYVSERDRDQASTSQTQTSRETAESRTNSGGGSAVHSASPPLDVSRDVSIVLNTLKALGMVKDSNEDIESRDESTLKTKDFNYYSSTAKVQKANAGKQSSLVKRCSQEVESSVIYLPAGKRFKSQTLASPLSKQKAKASGQNQNGLPTDKQKKGGILATDEQTIQAKTNPPPSHVAYPKGA